MAAADTSVSVGAISTAAARKMPASKRRVRLRPRWVALSVFALLALYGTMAWTASFSKGVSFDEGLQLAVGYNIWLNGDHRVEGANGDLIKRWATLPYLWSRPAFLAADDPLLRDPDSYAIGHRFFFELGNTPESLLWQGRAMVALLGIATGLLVFACSRELFGNIGGIISLAMFAFSPNMLAFGGIVSTDLSITFTLLGSTWCIWRLLRKITVGRLLASLAFFGLLLLAKMTAVIIFPITAVLVAVKWCAGGAWTVRWRNHVWRVHSWQGRVFLVTALVAIHALCGWSTIWAHYGFRYAASPQSEPANARVDPTPLRDGSAGIAGEIVTRCREARLLPEGYCRGVYWLLGDDEKLPAFMAGETKLGGWRTFFPYAIWVKTRPVLFFLIAIGIGTFLSTLRKASGALSKSAPIYRTHLYNLIPHLLLIGFCVGSAVAKDLNLGHRHVLPIYPSLYVLCGAAALALANSGRWLRVAISASLVWGALDSVKVRPHYLGFFGAQAGGSEAGHKHLVDSSLDWGMNLPGLKRWLDENNPKGEKVFLAYFGTDDPSYHGIEAQRLPGFFDRRDRRPYGLAPGYYAISATLFQGVYLAAFGRWNSLYEDLYRRKRRAVELFESTAGDAAARAELLRLKPENFWRQQYDTYDHLRFARLCAWLRQQGPPPHHIGYALFIWKLDYANLQAALLGPPPELGQPPEEWQRIAGQAH